MIYFKLRILTGTVALVHNLLIDLANWAALTAEKADKLIDKLEKYEVWF